MELRNFLFPQHNFVETRASSFGSGAETADLIRKAQMIDLRNVGCPDDIFEFVLEKRAERRAMIEQRGSNIHVSDPSTAGRDAMQLRLSHALRS
jgi:hypothetical protein